MMRQFAGCVLCSTLALASPSYAQSTGSVTQIPGIGVLPGLPKLLSLPSIPAAPTPTPGGNLSTGLPGLPSLPALSGDNPTTGGSGGTVISPGGHVNVPGVTGVPTVQVGTTSVGGKPNGSLDVQTPPIFILVPYSPLTPPPAPPGICGVPGAPNCCASDAECTDGVFCNGIERCMPGASGTNDHGCLPSPGSACMQGQSCDEATQHCDQCAPGTEDQDHDGVASVECGGNDCDDADALRYPGAPEICDAFGRDEDCNPLTSGVLDADQDGHSSIACCNRDPSGVSHCGDDCNDGAIGVHPDAVEVCNGVDDNCDGQTDENVSVALYDDMDGDNHGAPGSFHTGCAGAPGTAALGNDCNDQNPAIQPGSIICDAARGPAAVKICNPFQTPRVPAGSYVDSQCLQGTCRPQPNGAGDCQ